MEESVPQLDQFLAITPGFGGQVGVEEYLTVEGRPKRFTWRHLSDGTYTALIAGPDGILNSRVFACLWLNQATFWSGDGPALLATLSAGMATPRIPGVRR